MREYVPSDDGATLKFGIVAAQWHESIVRRLVDGALTTLASRGVAPGDIEVRWVPGCLELPWAALMASGPNFTYRVGSSLQLHDFSPQAVIALGCILRGETEHFRLVADQTAAGLMRVSLDTHRPVLNGVLACESLAQAEARAGGAHGNTGAQVALAAVRCVNQLFGRYSR